MSDYIERATTIEAFTEAEREADCPGADFPVIKRMLANLPAADVVEVRHGRWIPSDMGGGEPDEAYICSECGEPLILNEGTPEENNMRYCPACGARMDKEDEPSRNPGELEDKD